MSTGCPGARASLPVSEAHGNITTIEGVAGGGRGGAGRLAAIDVPQCGYCQSGQIMSAVALLRDIPKPTDADIDAAMAGNICRCATYHRIRAAIHDAAKPMEG